MRCRGEMVMEALTRVLDRRFGAFAKAGERTLMRVDLLKSQRLQASPTRAQE